jgi:hypothetical protein
VKDVVHQYYKSTSSLTKDFARVHDTKSFSAEV